MPTTPDEPGDVPEIDEPVVDWIMAMEESLMAQMSEMEALEPPSLAAARKSLDWSAWEKAIHEELDVLQAAGTWEMVSTPVGANIVSSKWVF